MNIETRSTLSRKYCVSASDVCIGEPWYSRGSQWNWTDSRLFMSLGCTIFGCTGLVWHPKPDSDHPSYHCTCKQTIIFTSCTLVMTLKICITLTKSLYLTFLVGWCFHACKTGFPTLKIHRTSFHCLCLECCNMLLDIEALGIRGLLNAW